LVYLVMASQFESLLHPFVILFTIPLALVGAIAALLLTGSPISGAVFIGLILLVGLVVKNAIILIDKVNQLREAGVAKREALVEGARSRLRPIMMTTLTAVFGFMPLALAPLFGSPGAEVRSPMAITVIGGLLVSTLLTLLVIPVVYDLLDRKPDEYYAERGRRARRRPGLSHEHHRAVDPPPGHHHHAVRVDGGDRPDRLLPPADGGRAGGDDPVLLRLAAVCRLHPGGGGAQHRAAGGRGAVDDV